MGEISECQSSQKYKASGTKKNPILFVHGYLDSSATPWWSVLEWRLKKEGFKESMIHKINLADTPLPGFSVNSPKTYAEKISKKVEDILIQHDAKQVDIIAHSMGGLDARWYTEKLGGEESVEKLITLGTPHYGSILAYLGYLTPGGRDVVPGSPFLKELNKEPLPEGIKYTAVWSRGDYAIIPAKNARLEGANNIDVSYCGHIMLVWSNRSFKRAILPALRETK